MTESVGITDEYSHTTLPSSTSGQLDSDLGLLLEPSGEAAGSSSDISSTLSSEDETLREHFPSEDEEVVPLADSGESDPPPWLKELEKPDGDADTDASLLSAAGPSVTAVYTQSPDTVTDPDSESAADVQSDSSADSYFLVSAEPTPLPQPYMLHQHKPPETFHHR